MALFWRFLRFGKFLKRILRKKVGQSNIKDLCYVCKKSDIRIADTRFP